MQTYKIIKLALATAALSTTVLAAATVANAADMAPTPFKAAPVPYLNWTGLYVGANAGGGWFDVNGTNSTNGFVGGGQVGYNYQIGRWVWGAELEVSGSSVGNVDTVTTAAARGGYTFDRWLVYGKLGGGWLDVSGPAGGSTSSAVFGVGAEYALTSRWSAKVEYNYFDLAHNAAGDSASFQTLKVGVNYHFPNWPF